MTDNATMRFIPFLRILPDLSTAADRKTSKSGPRDGSKIQPVAASRIAESVVRASYPLRLAKPMRRPRSEEHTSELQSLMRISYAVFCLKKKKNIIITYITTLKDKQPHKKQQRKQT